MHIKFLANIFWNHWSLGDIFCKIHNYITPCINHVNKLNKTIIIIKIFCIAIMKWENSEQLFCITTNPFNNYGDFLFKYFKIIQEIFLNNDILEISWSEIWNKYFENINCCLLTSFVLAQVRCIRWFSQ